MSKKTLQRFQELARDSGVALFTHAKTQLDAAAGDANSRALAVNHNGYLLIEAPTGSGKTLIAGNIVEQFSAVDDVVWFWFAPFKGVVGQTISSLREEFQGLRLRDLQNDRGEQGSRRGDVFVTTWQTVATRVKDKRNVRKDGDENPSIDGLLEALRAQKLRIGVVVDEAHHGFHGDTQAANFFREVLQPEYTVLITATPDDDDIKDFERRLGEITLHRISVSREDARVCGLIKDGVKCAAYFVEPEKEALADLEGTALRDAVGAHRTIKQVLKDSGISLAPLLLVQAKDQKSVAALREKVLSLGFTKDQVKTHTSNEPDSGLLSVANDECVEVLIFVMAVALGFDAPRAFTLVSMRASRDADFGVQLVGRILRVHRRLQVRARDGKLPEALRYGYVFLADAETQTGMDEAGQRINQIQTEYAKISPATVVVRVGGAPMIQVVGSDNQTGLFPTPMPTPGTSGGTGEGPEFQLELGEFFGSGAGHSGGIVALESLAPAIVSTQQIKIYRYPLRAKVPKRFKSQVPCVDNEVTEQDCANRFIVSTAALLDAMKSRVGVQKRILEIFTQEIQTEMNFNADLSAEAAAEIAQKVLFRSKVFDGRELRQALLKKLEAVLKEGGFEQAENPAKVKHFLNMILATHPELLYEAQKAATAEHAQIQDADELPAELTSEDPLSASSRNVYGVVPSGLNGWERHFAQVLDHSAGNTIQWWHRNLPHKPWSVNVLMPDGRGFFPDFIVGVHGRKTENGVLLAEPKMAFERSEEAAKTQARHGVYGRVLVLHREGDAKWMVVRYDSNKAKPVLGEEFRVADAAGY